MHNNLTYSAVWRPQAAPSADAGAVRNALSPIDHREIQAPAARLAATSLCRIQQPIDSIRPSADWNSSEHRWCVCLFRKHAARTPQWKVGQARCNFGN